ncbi:MAG: dihydropteroate synthase [Chitinophagales bacterium]|nr:dihydropteroate synthase [Chitinophagales bacterium]
MILNCNGQLLDLSTPKVMGILNLTPDSFYDGGKYVDNDSALQHAAEMIAEGADIIDIGGMSSKSGATIIPADVETLRVIPVIKAIHSAFPKALISIDTIHATTANAAVEAGASIVNDISGGDYDKAMFSTVAKLGVPFIAMHMRGTPETMQSLTHYEEVVTEVYNDLKEKLLQCKAAGIKDVILDPGFGFAKTVGQNFILLNQLNVFNTLQVPLLAGLSRKSMVTKTLHISKEEALNGTTVLNTIALINGANILRVHDVKQAKEAVQLFCALHQTA